MKYRTIYFAGDKLRLLDQTRLPHETEYIDCLHCEDVFHAIKDMKVRGAPAIGVAAAYGLVLAALKKEFKDTDDWTDAISYVSMSADRLNGSRPTAVNLSWAVTRMLKRVKAESMSAVFSPETLRKALLREANLIFEEDQRSCEMIGRVGAPLIKNGYQVMTYCNAGALATSGMGTATSPMYFARKEGRRFNIYCCETRPRFQGAKLTAWELKESGLNPILICDNTAAVVMKRKNVDLVIVGADRIAANGDVANKLGTYNLAVLANYHKIPFYVAAPISTFDLKMNSGYDISIEVRHPDEATVINGKRICPDVPMFCPAFDVTPGELITGIITDRGLIKANEKEIRDVIDVVV